MGPPRRSTTSPSGCWSMGRFGPRSASKAARGFDLADGEAPDRAQAGQPGPRSRRPARPGLRNHPPRGAPPSAPIHARRGGRPESRGCASGAGGAPPPPIRLRPDAAPWPPRPRSRPFAPKPNGWRTASAALATATSSPTKPCFPSRRPSPSSMASPSFAGWPRRSGRRVCIGPRGDGRPAHQPVPARARRLDRATRLAERRLAGSAGHARRSCHRVRRPDALGPPCEGPEARPALQVAWRRRSGTSSGSRSRSCATRRDFLGPLYRGRKIAKRFTASLADLQEELGRYNDMATTRKIVASFADDPAGRSQAAGAVLGWQAQGLARAPSLAQIGLARLRRVAGALGGR